MTCDLTLGSPLFSNLMDRVCILYFYKPHRKLTKSQTITLQTQSLWIRGIFFNIKGTVNQEMQFCHMYSPSSRFKPVWARNGNWTWLYYGIPRKTSWKQCFNKSLLITFTLVNKIKKWLSGTIKLQNNKYCINSTINITFPIASCDEHNHQIKSGFTEKIC